MIFDENKIQTEAEHTEDQRSRLESLESMGHITNKIFLENLDLFKQCTECGLPNMVSNRGCSCCGDKKFEPLKMENIITCLENNELDEPIILF